MKRTRRAACLGSAITFSPQMVLATDLVAFLHQRPDRRAPVGAAAASLGPRAQDALLEEVIRKLERVGIIERQDDEPAVLSLNGRGDNATLADVADAVGELTDVVVSSTLPRPDPGDPVAVARVVQRAVLAALRSLSFGG